MSDEKEAMQSKREACDMCSRSLEDKLRDVDNAKGNLQEIQRLHERTIKESIVDMQQMLKDKAKDLLQTLNGHCADQLQQLEANKDLLRNRQEVFLERSSALKDKISKEETELGEDEKSLLAINTQEMPNVELPDFSTEFSICFDGIKAAIESLQLKIAKPETPMISEELELPALDLKPGHQIQGQVASPVSPKASFWLMPLMDENRAFVLHRISLAIRTKYLADSEWQTFATMRQEPRVGQQVYAQCDHDGKWHRGRVEAGKTAGKNCFLVKFTDYGNGQEVTLRRMLPVKVDIAPKVPPQAVECCLFPDLDRRMLMDSKWSFNDLVNEALVSCTLKEQIKAGKDDVSPMPWCTTVQVELEGGEMCCVNDVIEEKMNDETSVKKPAIACRDIRITNPELFSNDDSISSPPRRKQPPAAAAATPVSATPDVVPPVAVTPKLAPEPAKQDIPLQSEVQTAKPDSSYLEDSAGVVSHLLATIAGTSAPMDTPQADGEVRQVFSPPPLPFPPFPGKRAKTPEQPAKENKPKTVMSSEIVGDISEFAEAADQTKETVSSEGTGNKPIVLGTLVSNVEQASPNMSSDQSTDTPKIPPSAENALPKPAEILPAEKDASVMPSQTIDRPNVEVSGETKRMSQEIVDGVLSQATTRYKTELDANSEKRDEKEVPVMNADPLSTAVIKEAENQLPKELENMPDTDALEHSTRFLQGEALPVENEQTETSNDVQAAPVEGTPCNQAVVNDSEKPSTQDVTENLKTDKTDSSQESESQPGKVDRQTEVPQVSGEEGVSSEEKLDMPIDKPIDSGSVEAESVSLASRLTSTVSVETESTSQADTSSKVSVNQTDAETEDLLSQVPSTDKTSADEVCDAELGGDPVTSASSNGNSLLPESAQGDLTVTPQVLPTAEDSGESQTEVSVTKQLTDLEDSVPKVSTDAVDPISKPSESVPGLHSANQDLVPQLATGSSEAVTQVCVGGVTITVAANKHYPVTNSADTTCNSSPSVSDSVPGIPEGGYINTAAEVPIEGDSVIPPCEILKGDSVIAGTENEVPKGDSVRPETEIPEVVSVSAGTENGVPKEDSDSTGAEKIPKEDIVIPCTEDEAQEKKSVKAKTEIPERGLETENSREVSIISGTEIPKEVSVSVETETNKEDTSRNEIPQDVSVSVRAEIPKDVPISIETETYKGNSAGTRNETPQEVSVSARAEVSKEGPLSIDTETYKEDSVSNRDYISAAPVDTQGLTLEQPRGRPLLGAFPGDAGPAPPVYPLSSNGLTETAAAPVQDSPWESPERIEHPVITYSEDLWQEGEVKQDLRQSPTPGGDSSNSSKEKPKKKSKDKGSAEKSPAQAKQAAPPLRRLEDALPQGQRFVGGKNAVEVVTDISNTGEFWVSLARDAEAQAAFTSLHNQLRVCAKIAATINPSSIQPRLMALVPCSKESVWYRGVIEDIPENKSVTVRLIDIGEQSTIPISMLRELPDKLHHLQIQTMHCSIHSPDYPIFTEQAKQLFKQLTKNKILTVEVVQLCSNNMCYVDLLDESDPENRINILKTICSQVSLPPSLRIPYNLHLPFYAPTALPPTMIAGLQGQMPMMLSGQGDATNQPVFMQPVITMSQQMPQQPDHTHQWRQPPNQSQEFQMGANHRGGGWGQERSLTGTAPDGSSEGGSGNQWPPEGHRGQQWRQPPNQSQEFQMGANQRGGGWGQERSLTPHSGTGTASDGSSEGGSGTQLQPDGHRGSSDELWLEGPERMEEYSHPSGQDHGGNRYQGQGRPRRQPKGNRGGGQMPNRGGGQMARSDIRCFNCKTLGHYKNDCPKPFKRPEGRGGRNHYSQGGGSYSQGGTGGGQRGYEADWAS